MKENKYNIICKNYKFWNFIADDNSLLFTDWFNSLEKEDDLYIVSIENKGYNILNNDGEFLSEIWFDDVIGKSGNFHVVYVNGKGYNILNTKGELLSNLWFDKYEFLDTNWDSHCSLYEHLDRGYHVFKEGFFKVYIKNKGYNFICEKNKFISDRWVENVENYFYFRKEIIILESPNREYNFINIDKKLLLKEWVTNYKKVIITDSYFNTTIDSGIYIVYIKDKGYNLLNRYGLMSKEWYDEIKQLDNDFFKIYKKDKGYNLLSFSGKLKSETWFNDISKDSSIIICK